MIRASVVGILLVATAAIAQPIPDSGPRNDPSEVVCVKFKEIGSRLTTGRVCRTRAEWAEYRSQTRQMVERVQALKPTMGN